MRSSFAAAALLVGWSSINLSPATGSPPIEAGQSAETATSGDVADIIRDLEERDRKSVLARDMAEAEALRDENFMVNTPDNSITVGRGPGIERLRKGGIDYQLFDRVIERIEVDGDVAVAMGSEAVRPRSGPQTGELIRRRYTNVWMLKDGRWQLRFRHANVIAGQPQILDR